MSKHHRSDDFHRMMKEIHAGIARAGKFEPGAWYSKEGDCIFVHWEGVPYYAEWINHDLTLYRAMDDKRIVGCAITWITSLMEKSGVIATLVEQSGRQDETDNPA